LGEEFRDSGEKPPLVVAVVTEEVPTTVYDFQSVVIVDSEVEVSIQTVLVLVDGSNKAIVLHIREVVSGPALWFRNQGVEIRETDERENTLIMVLSFAAPRKHLVAACIQLHAPYAVRYRHCDFQPKVAWPMQQTPTNVPKV